MWLKLKRLGATEIIKMKAFFLLNLVILFQQQCSTDDFERHKAIITL
jgi:hypothetical protein